jgi:subtilisin-like proprotein convertase family protein
MKTHRFLRFSVSALAALGWTAALSAATYVFDFANLNLAVPDGSSAGVSDTRSLSLPATPITHVTVSLSLRARDGQPAFNGDLYAALTHESGYSVLLNRPGRRPGSVLGYGDNGFDVVFDDDAAQGDVHAYRLTLNGDHATRLQPTGSLLTGTWAPDGRTSLPAEALLGDSRTALLDEFRGLNANGDWTLLVVDWESGGLVKLDRWALAITLAPIPEPRALGAVAAVALVVGAGIRRWRRQTG